MTASQLLGSFLWAACYLQTLEVDPVEERDLLRYRGLVLLDGSWEP
jgi:hypothetical protein